MTQRQKVILSIFKMWFPYFQVKACWSKGPFAIRVRTNSFADDLVFTYGDDDNWSLNSMSSYKYCVERQKA